MRAEQNQYSTADYCETPDSSMRPCLEFPNARRIFHVPRCSRKHYKFPITSCYHQPKLTHSFPRRSQRAIGKRRRQSFDETTSVDERKSCSSYSSVLTVDVRREMEAVNRDIEEIIRRCDDYCVDGDTSCKECCHHRSNHHRKSTKTLRGLTQEQIRILSMKRPPIEKLKDVPVSMLRPRPPKHSNEKPIHPSHSKFKTSRDIRHIVDETDDLLRDVYKELTRNKRHEHRKEEPIGCHCEETRVITVPKPATCLERYLGNQNKCRRLHENRWMKPKWKDIFDKGNYNNERSNETSKHFHDTNCISERSASTCLANPKQPTKPSKPELIDTGVNTDSNETLSENKITKEPIDTNADDIVSKETYRTVNSSMNENPISIDIKKIINSYPMNKSISNSNSEFNKMKSFTENFELKSTPKKISKIEEKYDEFSDSLLLDRNLGLSLEKMPSVAINESKIIQNEISTRNETKNKSIQDLTPVVSTLQQDRTTQLDDHYEVNHRKGAGDSPTVESSKYLVSQIINKIVSRSGDWAQNNIKTVDIACYDHIDHENSDVDSAICLEIMRRLVDLMTRNHQKIVDKFIDMPAQYSRIRKIKLDHLMNIEKEIQCIQDLEFYLRNASPARSNM